MIYCILGPVIISIKKKKKPSVHHIVFPQCPVKQLLDGGNLFIARNKIQTAA